MIPIYKPYLNGNEKFYVNQCLDSTWISSRGEFIERFEFAFIKFTDSKYATTVSNGTVAIHLALESLGIGPGDEVIVPTLTYIASVNPIVQCGATPIFVNALEDTWNIDPQDIKRKITPKTKCILIVHLYGMSCDMDEIIKICNEHNLLLIEDCAEAFGTKYKDKHVGNFGDIATFSFFSNKTITTGEGGMLLFKNEFIFKKARHLKSQAVSSTKEYWHDMLGYNYRMTNIAAAIGLAQIEQANEILKKKRFIAELYRAELDGLPLKFHNEIPDTTHSYWMCSILLDDSVLRDLLRSYLNNNNIETRPVFYPCHTLPHMKTAQKFLVAESIAKRGINLPSYPSLSQENIFKITKTVREFFKENFIKTKKGISE